MPAISIIIPTFNRAQLLAQAIKSVLAQTYEDYELIIVDDGSTDNTREVVHGFRDDRIHYIYQRNTNRIIARNNARGHVDGRYIAFLDSDDLWFPNKLELQASIFERHSNIGLVYSSCVRVNSTGEYCYPQDFLLGRGEDWIGSSHDELLLGDCVPMPTAVVRRDIFDAAGWFDASLHYAEDWDAWIRVSALCDSYRIGRPLAAYRVHPGQMSNHLAEELETEASIREKHQKSLPGDTTAIRLRSEMISLEWHGFQALLKGMPESEAWLGRVQELALALDEPGTAAYLSTRHAIYEAAYNADSRHRAVDALSQAANIYKSRGGPAASRECIREFWACWIHYCHALKDPRVALQCIRELVSSCGVSSLDRGIYSIAIRSLLAIATRAKPVEVSECQP